MAHEIILPTDWFASMDASGFAGHLLGTRDRCAKFWNQVSSNDPKLFQNPFYDNPTNKDGAVPLLLFGDGAQHAEHDSVTAVAIRSMMVDVPVSDSMFLLAAAPKSATAKDAECCSDTWKSIWQILSWNFHFLALGIHPTTDHENKPWPAGSKRAGYAGKKLCPNSGLKGVIWVIAADYEYMESEYGLKHHGSNTPCSWCDCNTTTVPFNDFSKEALWKAVVRTPEMHRTNPPIQHAVLNIPGVVFEMFHLDVLHCFDLGVSEHVFGNLLNDICEDHLHMTKPRAIAELNTLIHKFYDELRIPAPTRIPYLAYKHFSSSTYPCLAHIKGSRVRAFAPVALELAKHFVSDERYTQHRLGMCTALNNAYECINSPDKIWDSNVHSKFKKAVEACLAHYQWLAKWSMNTAGKEHRYSIVPKHHYAGHFEQQAKHIAPRCTWTYGGETFMGIIASLTQACVRGRRSTILSSALLNKFVYGKMLRIGGLLEVSQDNYFSDSDQDC